MDNVDIRTLITLLLNPPRILLQAFGNQLLIHIPKNNNINSILLMPIRQQGDLFIIQKIKHIITRTFPFVLVDCLQYDSILTV